MLEYRIQDYIHSRIGGKVETSVSISDICIGRIDIETDDSIIEVKQCSKWKHALGQLLVYVLSHKKKMYMYLYGDIESSTWDIIKSTCNKYSISVVPIHLTLSEGSNIIKCNMIPESFPTLSKSEHFARMKERSQLPSVVSILNSYSKSELQEILSLLKGETTGTISVLIDRILEHDRLHIHDILSTFTSRKRSSPKVETIETLFERVTIQSEKHTPSSVLRKFADGCTGPFLKIIADALSIRYTSRTHVGELLLLIYEYCRNHILIFSKVETIFSLCVQKEYSLLKFIPEAYRTKKVCNPILEDKDAGCILQYIPDDLKTQELCHNHFQIDSSSYLGIPVQFITYEMSECFWRFHCKKDIKDRDRVYIPIKHQIAISSDLDTLPIEFITGTRSSLNLDTYTVEAYKALFKTLKISLPRQKGTYMHLVSVMIKHNPKTNIADVLHAYLSR